MTGVELMADMLKRWGVEFVATLCGHGLDPLDAACEQVGIRLVDVRNEQAAGYMAEAYGRLSRRVGVCASSSGVAHVNALTGVLNAYFDGVPMLLITGSGPTPTIGRGHFQDVDQVALAAPICKYADTIDRPERVPEYLYRAWMAAINGRPGPTHLTFPLDVMQAQVDDTKKITLYGSPERLKAAAPQEGIHAAADLIRRSVRPVLVAGSGVYYAEGETELLRMAETLSIPIVTPIWDRGSVLGKTDVFMGVVGAATGGPVVLKDADCVIAAGVAPDYRVGYFQPPALAPEASLIRIDADPEQLRKGPGAHVSLCCDPRLALERLTDACDGCAPFTGWLCETQHRREVFQKKLQRPSAAPLHALDIVEAVRTVMTDDTILIVDGGNIGQWVHQTLCDRYPGHWLTCGASGVVGYGLPAAMTARLLYPDRPVILVSGDGSLTFTFSEIEAAARQRLGLAIVLADDRAWGITLTGHIRQFGRGITSELGAIAFAEAAQAFGGHGVRIAHPEEIAPALQTGMTGDRPTLIHVPIVRSNPSDGG
ncbi:MAG: thiamine pyrophosphate-binding protein [candidate division Zixibacteria bacterium]|nr:thiamine pyrophosphate-binding protein [candidate division Zixibacteria bacterium]